MALPYTRNESHGAQSPVKGTTVDAIQDCITGQKKPVLTKVFGPLGGGMNPNPTANWSSSGIGLATQMYMTSTAAVNLMFYFPVETGDRIVGLRARVYGDGIVDCTWNAGYLDSNGVLQPLGTLADMNRSAAWADFSVTPWTNRTMQAGEMLAAYLQISAANYRIQKFFVDYDRP